MTSHSDIMAKLGERHEKQDISIVDGFPLLVNVSTNVILGSFSWYWMEDKKKSILRKFHMNFDGTITTPSEIARTYLELKYKRQRATGEQVRNFEITRTAPLYAQPHRFEDAVYVDLRSAYWQILQIVGWDADYNPNKWLGRGEEMADFPYADIKLSRNCLITAGLPTDATFWKGKEQAFKRLPTRNKTANMGIWSLTMDILHGVAWDVIAAGAAYAHTDGYICHVDRLGAVMGAIAEWGLEARIKKTGMAQVYGVGSYTFGNSETNTPKQDHAYSNLVLPPKLSWLRNRIRFFSERTEFKWQSTFTPEREKSTAHLILSPQPEKS